MLLKTAGLTPPATDRTAEILARAGTDRLHAFIRGVRRYRQHLRAGDDRLQGTVLWQSGACRLLLHPAAPAVSRNTVGPSVLLVPSLVNRATIFDLAPGMSLAAALADAGLRVMILDWGTPGPTEMGLDVAGYVTERLLPALDAAAANDGSAPRLLGYCMGGLLTLAAAVLRPERVERLALVAMPWDFAQMAQGSDAVLALYRASLPAIDLLGHMPVDAVQCLFACLDPLLVPRKFAEFAAAQGPAVQRFVALEDWVNDGVPLTAGVARTCFADWFGANTPQLGRWQVAGQAITPDRLRPPTLAVIPGQDRIVPPPAAEAVLHHKPEMAVLRPSAGHVGMMVGSRARRELWTPLANWLTVA